MVVLPALGNTKLFNLYMPSGSKKVKERVAVTEKLNDQLTLSLEKRIILGGDINMIEGRNDVDKIKRESVLQRIDVRKFKTCRKEQNLVDVFRKQKPNAKVFTRIRSDTASRIDKLYIKTNSNDNIGMLTHVATPFSDHCLAPMVDIMENKHERERKTRWKLNTKLLGKHMKKKVVLFLEDWRKKKHTTQML